MTKTIIYMEKKMVKKLDQIKGLSSRNSMIRKAVRNFIIKNGERILWSKLNY